MKILHIPSSGALREVCIPDERAVEDFRSLFTVREYKIMDLPGHHFGMIVADFGNGEYPGKINRRASPLYAGYPTYNVYGDAYIVKLESEDALGRKIIGLSDDEIAWFKNYIIRL